MDRSLRIGPPSWSKLPDAAHPLWLWRANAVGTLDLAAPLLSLRLAVRRLFAGTHQPLARARAFPATPSPGRLACGRELIVGSVDLRLLLGTLELLLLSQMDLPHARCRVPPHFRNAAPGLWRLSPLRLGTLCPAQSRLLEQ